MTKQGYNRLDGGIQAILSIFDTQAVNPEALVAAVKKPFQQHLDGSIQTMLGIFETHAVNQEDLAATDEKPPQQNEEKKVSKRWKLQPLRISAKIPQKPKNL